MSKLNINRYTFPDGFVQPLGGGSSGHEGEIGEILVKTLKQKNTFDFFIGQYREKVKPKFYETVNEYIDSFILEKNTLSYKAPFPGSVEAIVSMEAEDFYVYQGQFLGTDEQTGQQDYAAQIFCNFEVWTNKDYFLHTERYEYGPMYPMRLFDFKVVEISGSDDVYTFNGTELEVIEVSGSPTIYKLEGVEMENFEKVSNNVYEFTLPTEFYSFDDYVPAAIDDFEFGGVLRRVFPLRVEKVDEYNYEYSLPFGDGNVSVEYISAGPPFASVSTKQNCAVFKMSDSSLLLEHAVNYFTAPLGQNLPYYVPSKQTPLAPIKNLLDLEADIKDPAIFVPDYTNPFTGETYFIDQTINDNNDNDTGNNGFNFNTSVLLELDNLSKYSVGVRQKLLSSVKGELLYEDTSLYDKMANFFPGYMEDQLSYITTIREYDRELNPPNNNPTYPVFRRKELKGEHTVDATFPTYDVPPNVYARSITINTFPKHTSPNLDDFDTELLYKPDINSEAQALLPEGLRNHAISIRDFIEVTRKSLKNQFTPFYTLEELHALGFRGEFYRTRADMRRLMDIVSYHEFWIEIADRILVKNSETYNTNFKRYMANGFEDENEGYQLDPNAFDVEEVLTSASAISAAEQEIENRLDTLSSGNPQRGIEQYREYSNLIDDEGYPFEFDEVEFSRNRVIKNNLNGMEELKNSIERRLEPIRSRIALLRNNLNGYRLATENELNKRTDGITITLAEFDFKFRFANKDYVREEFTVKPYTYDFANKKYYEYIFDKYNTPLSDVYTYRCQLDPYDAQIEYGSDNYMNYVSITDPMELFYSYFEARNKNIPLALRGEVDPYGFKSDFISIMVDMGYELANMISTNTNKGTNFDNVEILKEALFGGGDIGTVPSHVGGNPGAFYQQMYPKDKDGNTSKSAKYGEYRNLLIEGPSFKGALTTTKDKRVFDLKSFMVPAKRGFHHWRPVGINFPDNDRGVYDPGEYYSEFLWFRRLADNVRLLAQTDYTFSNNEYFAKVQIPADFGPIDVYNPYPLETETEFEDKFKYLTQPTHSIIYPVSPFEYNKIDTSSPSIANDDNVLLRFDRSWNQGGSVYIDDIGGGLEKVVHRSRRVDNTIIDLSIGIEDNSIAGLAVSRDVSFGNKGILPSNYGFVDWYPDARKYPQELVKYTDWLLEINNDPRYFSIGDTTIAQLNYERTQNVPSKTIDGTSVILSVNDYVIDET
jgi:hypothetical protein